jgi:hypothetical protein
MSGDGSSTNLNIDDKYVRERPFWVYSLMPLLRHNYLGRNVIDTCIALNQAIESISHYHARQTMIYVTYSIPTRVINESGDGLFCLFLS